jgi:hypothetical protein
LSEYSNTYRVSISTLRRRIRSEDVIYCFEDGKYLLKDYPLKEHKVKRPNQSPSGSFAPPRRDEEPDFTPNPPVAEQVATVTAEKSSGPFLTAAQEMLSELKKAYSIILQEKQEQVLLLKDEVADLRTLVGVLEEDNLRLKRQLTDGHSLDNWLSNMEMKEL